MIRLMLVGNFWPGAPDSHARFLQEAQERGYEVSLARKTPMPERHSGQRVAFFPLSSSFRGELSRALLKAVSLFQPTIIHNSSLEVASSGVLRSIHEQGILVVNSLDEVSLASPVGAIQWFNHRRVVRHSVRLAKLPGVLTLFTSTEELLRWTQVAGIPPQQSEVLPLAMVDLSKFSPVYQSKYGETLILYQTDPSTVAMRRSCFLIERLSSAFPNLKFLVAAEDYTSFVRNRLLEFLPPRFRSSLLGPQAISLTGALLQGGILCALSWRCPHELLRVVLEAFASGSPVCLYGKRSPVQIRRIGGKAIICPENLKALHRELTFLLINPHQQNTQGIAGREAIVRHGLQQERVFRRLFEVYGRLIFGTGEQKLPKSSVF